MGGLVMVRPSASFGQPPPPGWVTELLGCGSRFRSALGLLWVEAVWVEWLLLFFGWLSGSCCESQEASGV